MRGLHDDGIGVDGADGTYDMAVAVYRELESIASQIERETLPRPLFEDGEPVQFGDEFPVGAKTAKVRRIEVCDNIGWVVSGDGLAATGGPRDRLKRPEPPDSWERIAEDVAKADACRYFGVEDKDQRECRECEAFKAHGLDVNCGEAMAADVLRRCKALAGVE